MASNALEFEAEFSCFPATQIFYKLQLQKNFYPAYLFIYSVTTSLSLFSFVLRISLFVLERSHNFERKRSKNIFRTFLLGKLGYEHA